MIEYNAYMYISPSYIHTQHTITILLLYYIYYLSGQGPVKKKRTARANNMSTTRQEREPGSSHRNISI